MPLLAVITLQHFTARVKVKPLEVLEKDTEGHLIQFFTSLTTEEQLDKKRAEEFIFALFGMKGDVKEVNEARYVKLCQMTGKITKVLRLSVPMRK